MITQSKLLDGLMKRMEDLFDEKERIFQEKYEVMGDKAVWSETETEEEKQLSLDIEEVFNAIGKETERLGWGKKEEIIEKPAVQGILLS